jgi:hypothetical protein
VRPREQAKAIELERELASLQRRLPMPGIEDPRARTALVEQLVESLRRVRYVSVVASRPISQLRADPASELFDPVLAAILQQDGGDYDEACWLVFLSVHFGKNRRAGWRLARTVYGGLGTAGRWTWQRVAADPQAFRSWLAANQSVLRDSQRSGAFGNHRKYQSLDAHKPVGTGSAIESYVGWIGPERGHQRFFGNALHETSGDPKAAFDLLYRSMKAVASFGRTARFDYLTMLAKVRLVPIEPGSVYLDGATGPLAGARLLLGPARSRRECEEDLAVLGARLGVGMHVLEDALCNWQKSPLVFKPFRG